MSGGNMEKEKKLELAREKMHDERMKLTFRYNNDIDAKQFRKQMDEIVKALDIDYYNKHKGEEEAGETLHNTGIQKNTMMKTNPY